MISHWHDFPSPERTFTSSVWDPFKRSQQIKKSPIKHSYINLQDKFLRPDLFCKLISLNLVISSVQLLSRVRLFATPWTAACQASLSITNSRRLLKFTTLGLVMPSNHLVIPFCSCLQSFPASGSFQISQFFLHQVAKVLEFQLQHQSFQWIFRTDFLWDLLAVQGTLKSLLQHHSSKASTRQRTSFFIVQLSHPYMTTGKTIALTRRTFDDKVMSLLFNMLSRLAIISLQGVSVF